MAAASKAYFFTSLENTRCLVASSATSIVHIIYLAKRLLTEIFISRAPIDSCIKW